MRKKMFGFSLIEVIMVVAIAGIVSTLAVNTYSNFQIQGMTANMLVMAEDSRIAVEKYYNLNGSLPASSALASVNIVTVCGSGIQTSGTGGGTCSATNASSKGIALLWWNPAGYIEIRSTNTLVGLTSQDYISIKLIPSLQNNFLIWTCSNAVTQSAFQNYIPSQCQ